MAENIHDQRIFKGLESNNISEVYNALVNLRTYYIIHELGMNKFKKYGAIKLVLPLIENPKLAEVALSIISNCCMDNGLRYELLATDCIKRLVRIMRGLACDSLQNRACRALGNLAISDEGSIAIHKLNAISLIVKFLTGTDDKNCQQTAIRTLRILGSGVKNCERIVLDRGVFVISKFLQSDDIDVLLCSVKAMASLTKKCSISSAKQLHEAEGIKTLVTLALHSNKHVQDNAVACLENLAGLSAIRPELGNAGAITIFIEIASSASSYKEVKSAVWALCLCCKEAVNRVRIRELNGFKILLEVLKDHKYMDIHENIVVSLLFFRYDEPSLDTLLDMDLITIVTKHLQKYVDDNESGADHDCSKISNKPKRCKSCSIEMCVPKESLIASESKEKEYDTLSSDKNSEVLDVKGRNSVSDDSKREIEALNSLPTSQNSFTFSIHSPSYQGIQNADTSISHYSVSDTGYRNFCSPPVAFSTYSSPDHFSVDYSLGSLSPVSSGSFSPTSSAPLSPASSVPLSPASSVPLSPASSVPLSPASSVPLSPASAAPLSPVSNEPFSPAPNEPFSPAPNEPFSPTPNEPFSPTSIEPFSPASNGPVSPISSNDTSACWSQASPKISVGKSQNEAVYGLLLDAEKVDKYLDSSMCTSDVALNDSCVNECDDDKTKISLHTCGKEKLNILDIVDHLNGSLKRKAEKSLVGNNINHYIILLLSHLSKVLKTSSKLAEDACIIALMDFLMISPQPDLKVHRIFLRLINNRGCFDKLILLNFFGKVDRKIKISHDLSVCDYCSELQELKTKILVSGSIVAESHFGIGTLSHILITGNKKAQLNSIYAFSTLVKQKALLKKLLIDSGGLIILLKFLSDSDEHVFKDVSVSLSRIYHSLNKEPSKGPVVELNELNIFHQFTEGICMYETSVHDVTFVLDCGAQVQASRAILSENSEFFQALLSGYYIEANKNIIRLSEITKNSLLAIFHYLHGCCRVKCLSSVDFEILLDLLQSCDRFLLLKLKTIIEKDLIADMKMVSAAKIYAFSKAYNSPYLAKHALHFTLLASDVKEEEFFHCLRELLLLPDADALNDIKHSIKVQFPGCRDQPLYSRNLSVDKM